MSDAGETTDDGCESPILCVSRAATYAVKAIRYAGKAATYAVKAATYAVTIDTIVNNTSSTIVTIVNTATTSTIDTIDTIGLDARPARGHVCFRPRLPAPTSS